MKKIILALVVCALCACQNGNVAIDNGSMRLEFDRATASLLSMTDLETGYEYIDEQAEPQRLWTVVPFAEGDVIPEPTEVKVRKISSREVKLSWKGNDAFTLVARVRLDKEKPLSYWSVEMSDYDGAKVKELIFPYLTNIKEFTNEEIALSNWTGRLYKNLRKSRKSVGKVHPNRPTMQLSAIYGEEPSGLYIATNDTLSYGKAFTIDFRENLTDYKMINILGMGAEIHYYKPTYDFILGTLHGDWYDAAQIYREWALQQHWVKNNRLHSGKMNKWLPETDLWMWNRGRSSNVLTEAADLKEYLGDYNVSVLWHWWHNGPYDDAFPEYIPPREGRESFVKAVAKAKSKGINMTPYMNSIQWGKSRKSWKELNIEQYVSRKADGSIHAYAYNKFTGNALTPLCMSQKFWHEKYSDLCDTVVNDYGCTGVYMDQACLHYWCYNPNHGHSVGGGNYWVKGYLKLVERVREKTAENNPILTGEGSGEDWMAHLDGFLTLECSRERMSGIGNSSVIPLFNAIYHENAITFGNFGGFTYPPYDEFWPQEFRAPNTEKLLPAIYNTQLRMEQARTFVFGIQPMIVNYHAFARKARPVEMKFIKELVAKRKQYKEYLQYGKLMRAPKLSNDHATEIDIAQMSTYGLKTAGTNLFPHKKVVPMLYSAAWRNAEGNILLTFVNISEEEKEFSFNIDLAEMGLNEDYTLYIDGVAQEGAPQSSYSATIKGCATKVFEFVKK